jgi:SAM-dependent methyltransferase
MRTFLHVGSGRARKEDATPGFASEDWREVRLDINPDVEPDIVSDFRDMREVADASVDAVFSSHNLEHLYPHEVQPALNEFLRVLRPEGFAVVTCPDLEGVCERVAQGGLLDPLYESEAGPIAPIDVIFGHRGFLAAGNLHMAHRCGFTEPVLQQTMLASGFGAAASTKRGHPYYDLWVVATKTKAPRPDMDILVQEHFPT